MDGEYNPGQQADAHENTKRRDHDYFWKGVRSNNIFIRPSSLKGASMLHENCSAGYVVSYAKLHLKLS